MPNRRLVVAAMAAAILLAGCTGGTPTPGPTAAPPSSNPRTSSAPQVQVGQAWRNGGVHPVSAVANVGGTAVVYGTDAGRLYLYGLDPGDGRTLWRKAAGMASLDGSTVTPAGAAGYVAYFRPSEPDGRADLVLADPATGADRVVTQPRYWLTEPQACPDDPTQICLQASVVGTAPMLLRVAYRVDPDDGTARPIDAAPGAVTIRPTGLTYLPSARPTRIGLQDKGKTLWTHTYADLLGPIADELDDWTDQMSPDGSTLLLDARGDGVQNPNGSTVDLAKDLVTTGTDQATGKRRWLEHGTSTGCLSASGLPPAAVEGHLLRCRYTGTATATGPAPDVITPAKNTRVRLESFDPATGKSDWSADLGHVPALTGASSTSATAAGPDTQLLIQTGSGPLAVDLATGRTTKPRAGSVFWCDQVEKLSLPGRRGTSNGTAAIASGVVTPCTADRKASTAAVRSVPQAVSTAFAGNRRIVAQPGAVVGYTMPPVRGWPGQTGTISPGPTSTGGPTNPAARTVTEQPTAPTPAWTSTGITPLTEPAVLGDTAVLYGTDSGGSLKLFGLDPQNGRQRWAFAASNGQINPDTPLRLTTFDGDAIVIAESQHEAHAPDTAPLARIDPATGKAKWRSKPMQWATRPDTCDSDGANLCASVWRYTSGDDHATEVRIDAKTGAVSKYSDDDEVQQIDNVTIRRKDGKRIVEGAVNGKTAWTVPVDTLIGKDARIRSYSWLRQSTPATLVISAEIGRSPDKDGAYPDFDLARNLVTVAVDRMTGKVLWRAPGAGQGCRWIVNFWMGQTPTESRIILCRYRGTLYSDPKGAEDPQVARGLSVTLQAVDWDTGKPAWSVDLGANEGMTLADSMLAPAVAGDSSILVHRGSGTQVVDLINGKQRPATAGEVFWCRRTVTFGQPVIWYDNGTPNQMRSGADLPYPCDANGSADTRPPASIPWTVSTAYGATVRLVATPDAVLAYRVD